MNKRKIGLVVGKFAPLHLGHVNMINRAASQVDHLFVVMSYDERFTQQQPPFMQKVLTRNNRLRWLKKTFSDLDHITILSVDETFIPEYPNGWEEFTDLVKRGVGEYYGISEFLAITDVFGSEPHDAERYEEFFPGSTYHIMDPLRTRVDMSATEIRKSVFDNWSFLPSVVRADFALKVAVVGPESCGKTTLVKYLAKAYATSWVEEYGRWFVENELCCDESLLEPHHYPWIAMNHKIQEQEALKTCNKIMFSDTDGSITEVFMHLYEDDYRDRDEYRRNLDLVKSIAKWESYDMIILLKPTVPWVDDGMRRISGEKHRNDVYNFIEYTEEKNNSLLKAGDGLPWLVKVDGSDYNSRLESSIAAVEKMFNHVKGVVTQ